MTRAIGLVLAAGIALTVGCSGSRAPTTGTVTGTLLIAQGLLNVNSPPRHAVGTVTATPALGGAAVTVRTDAHGTYVLQLPGGTYRLTSHIGGHECFSANVNPILVHDGKTVSDDVGCAS